jgi:hypothetical protein
MRGTRRTTASVVGANATLTNFTSLEPKGSAGGGVAGYHSIESAVPPTRPSRDWHAVWRSKTFPSTTKSTRRYHVIEHQRTVQGQRRALRLVCRGVALCIIWAAIASARGARQRLRALHVVQQSLRFPRTWFRASSADGLQIKPADRSVHLQEISVTDGSVIVSSILSGAALAQGGNLRAGAAKVDISPSPNMFPLTGMQRLGSLHDPLFARALVLNNVRRRSRWSVLMRLQCRLATNSSRPCSG